MRPNSIMGIALACVAGSCLAADESQDILKKKYGNADLATVVVDNAPGSVSAMGLLGISQDQTTIVQNPRDLTIAAKAFDGKNAFGLSITPARTSLVPLSISSYAGSPLARLWGSTTFSYAQGRAEVQGSNFERRAVAVETSYFFRPDVDDPLMMYWNALTVAGQGADDKDPCVLIPAQGPKPDAGSGGFEDVPASEKEALDKRAQQCRDKVAKAARWNVSRAWASFGTGTYRLADGGPSHGLGRSVVLGVTYGIGEKKDKTATALTAAVKHTRSAPTEDTMASATPERKSSTLVMGRVAVGGEKLRALFEGSNARNDSVTAADRVYKRAAGLDVWLREGMWLNVRVGKQRRVDNTGDETGSSVGLSYSPKALLGF